MRAYFADYYREHYDAQKPRRQTYGKQYRSRTEVMARARERAARDYARNPPLMRARSQAYRKRHPEVVRAYTKRYGEAHREAKRVSFEKWRVAHLQERAQTQARRRARERGAVGSHTLGEWLEKCALFGRRCFYCGEARPLTRDHKVPLIRGGSDFIDNIVPACRRCNCSKGTRTSSEFLAMRPAA